MGERIFSGDIGAILADGHDQLDLVVEVARSRRIGYVGATHNDGIGRLAEEKWRIARVIAHLDHMLGIVAAHAIDAPHREQPAPRDGDGCGTMRRKQEISHA
ncbi:hypothetical protein D3C72_2127020 [compost metagenome]